MKLFVLLTLAGSLSLAASSPRDSSTAKDDDKLLAPLDPAAKHVEVRFANGSNVIMILLQDNIEIITEFGKLEIPPAEIRQIEFGVHLAEAERGQIARALELLSSSNYKEREAAMKQLVVLGPQAYLALYQATRSKDQEAAKRAQIAMKTIAEKVPARLLRLREDDRIRTTKFTIVGRIVTPSIKARAEYFGDLSLHQQPAGHSLDGRHRDQGDRGGCRQAWQRHGPVAGHRHPPGVARAPQGHRGRAGGHHAAAGRSVHCRAGGSGTGGGRAGSLR